VNGGLVTEPRARLHLEDGRNFLLLDRGGPYDLISIEITSVWFAGATNLYSREFYELAKSRLRPGGAFQQWIQFHHITPRELAVEIATLRAVFPYVSLWSSGGQGMMVATDRPQRLTPERRAYMIERLSGLPGDIGVRTTGIAARGFRIAVARLRTYRPSVETQRLLYQYGP